MTDDEERRHCEVTATEVDSMQPLTHGQMTFIIQRERAAAREQALEEAAVRARNIVPGHRGEYLADGIRALKVPR